MKQRLGAQTTSVLTPRDFVCSPAATSIGLYFPRVAVGGFFFGLLAGKVTVFWLQHVFNDALVEITITLASTYLTFYIGEEVLGISGVLSVVMLGIVINSQKSSISPEVEVFLHRYRRTDSLHRAPHMQHFQVIACGVL